jgi:predicted ATPase
LRLPFYFSLLAVVYEQAGMTEKGLETVERALSAAACHNENWWNAELYRLRGNLLLQNDDARAEEAYQLATGLARQQKAPSLELRSTTSLARLWQRQGRAAQAHEALAAIYGSFTEGFDTPDLQAANALLMGLEGKSTLLPPKPTDA